MSDLILRIDAKHNVCIYRHKTRQGVMLSFEEAGKLWVLLSSAVSHAKDKRVPVAFSIGIAGACYAIEEFSRRITISPKGRIEVGAIQPDLFDVRKEECC